MCANATRTRTTNGERILNPYEILDVDPNASDDEIKKAYRKHARRHHPDVGGDPDAFRQATEAREILLNPERRSRFDNFGDTAKPKANRVELELLAMVAEAFCQTREDPVAWMEQRIDRVRSEHRKQRAGITTAIANMRKNLAAFQATPKTTNTEGEKLLVEGVLGSIEQASRDLERVDSEIRVCDEKLAKLSGLKDGRRRRKAGRSVSEQILYEMRGTIDFG